MATFSADIINTNSININGGAQEGYVLTSNSSGNATWSAPLDYVLELSSDVTAENTITGVTISDFNVYMLEGKNYRIEHHLVYSGNSTTGDYKVAFRYDSVATASVACFGYYVGYNIGSTAYTTSEILALGVNNFSINIGVKQADITQRYLAKFYMNVTPSYDGTFSFLCANAAAGSGTQSICRVGSYVKYKQVD